eukprot:Ihof_evm6s53 gene=Ihof_evmTU6s53
MPGAEILTKVTASIRKAAQDSNNKYYKKTKHMDVMSMKSVMDKDCINTYEITITTADRFSSGTRANVFITLFGSDGRRSDVITLDDKNDTNQDPDHYRFQRGQIDKFKVETPNLGELTKIRIGHDNTGVFASWLVDQVEVTDSMSTNTYHFACGIWLSVYDTDGQVVRDFPVEHQFQLSPQDFLKEASNCFTLEGGNCQVKDYAPNVFLNIREIYGIHTKDYHVSWTLPEDKLVAKEGAGRSGSLFLMSDDKKYMLKTVPHDEIVTFLEVLPAYYQHLADHPESLIMKVFGLMGLQLFYKGDYIGAVNHLIYAFDHCLATSHKNKRLILLYLVPCRLWMGISPTASLLKKYKLGIFVEISKAVRQGNIRVLNQLLANHEDVFVHRGLYLIMDRLRLIAYRNLIRTTVALRASITSDNAELNKMPNVVELDWFVTALAWQGDTKDPEEAECIIANLIYE